MATNATNAAIVTQLGLNNEETEAFNGMSPRERRRFNTLRDDNLKIVFVQALAEKEKSWREKSDLGHKLVGCGLHVVVLISIPIKTYRTTFSLHLSNLASTAYKDD
ncbi:4541_t:CDS:2 [Paraglomus brasilianum]|uniref:4541_t:CDS:1 n=1 Tax=Paraglomus brasilianum TaxID=144538 RepID=A0A9N8VKJ5_9GLOM|nr:4541_t:CDS:2 [Paraglomus brasilianum]